MILSLSSIPFISISLSLFALSLSLSLSLLRPFISLAQLATQRAHDAALEATRAAAAADANQLVAAHTAQVCMRALTLVVRLKHET